MAAFRSFVPWALALTLNLQQVGISSVNGQFKASALPFPDTPITRGIYVDPLTSYLKELKLSDGYQPFNANFGNDLVAKLDTNNPDVVNRVNGLAHSFAAKGMDADKALNSGYKLLDYSITKQAAILSYMDVFLYLGLMFLICVPFVLMVKAKKAAKLDPSAVH